MLYVIAEQLGFPGLLNLIRYISFRAGAASATALAIGLFLGPWMIRKLQEFQIGQVIRQDGPATHRTKAGTPTMGGLLILCAIVVPCLMWGNFHSRVLWIALGSTVWLGAIGFLDDWLRVVKGYPNGLLGRYKLIGQVTLGAVVGLLLTLWPERGMAPTVTHVPFMKFQVVDFGLLFVPFVILVKGSRGIGTDLVVERLRAEFA